ncbi:MAG: XRE family transcriptional regulator [Candidatus Arsenophonus phytopathogenicus]
MSRCQLARLKVEHKIYISDVIRETEFSCNTTTLMYKKLDVDALNKFSCQLNELLERVSEQ